MFADHSDANAREMKKGCGRMMRYCSSSLDAERRYKCDENECDRAGHEEHGDRIKPKNCIPKPL